jgi:hypothetical protein
MDAEAFRTHGKFLIDYIINYLENVKDSDVFPNVDPGFLRSVFPRNLKFKYFHWVPSNFPFI